MATPPSIDSSSVTPVDTSSLHAPSETHDAELAPPSSLPASQFESLSRRPVSPGNTAAPSLSRRIRNWLPIGGTQETNVASLGRPTISALAAQSMALAVPATPAETAIAADGFFNPTRLAKVRFSEPVKTGSISYYTGTVEKNAHGRLEADEYLVNALLQCTQMPTTTSARVLGNIDLQGGEANLTFSIDPRIIQCHADFEALCVVSDATTKTHSTSTTTRALGGKPVPILIPTLLRVLTEGRSAFKPDAKMGIPGHETQHPVDYLAEMMPQISSNNPALKHGIDGVLADRPDYRARVAAAQLLLMASTKETAVGGWALSTALAAVTNTPWVVYALPAFTRFLSSVNLSPTRAAASVAGLNMIPSTVIEIVDAAIGFVILNTLKKEDSSFKEIAPKALLAGVVSGLTSFPYTMLQQSGGIPDGSYPVLRDVANVALNVAAAVTQVMGAGISIPMEAQDGRQRLTAALTHSARDEDGLMSVPAHLADDKQVKKYFDDLSAKSTHYNPSDGAAEAAAPMMVGAALLSVALDSQSIVTHGAERLVSEGGMKIIDILGFQPIESHTLHAVWLASKMNIPLVMTSDEKKYKLLLEALTHAETTGVPFSRKDLDKIDPDLLRRLGSTISSVVMSVIHSVPGGIDLIRGRDTSLSGRIFYPPAASAESVVPPQIQSGDPAAMV